MQKDYIYINGKILEEGQAVILGKDQGLLFGYGLFETIRVYNSMPFMLTEHLKRLETSLRIMEIDIPSQYVLEDEIKRFISSIHLSDGVLRITITKGFKEATILFTHREVPYDPLSYEKGFTLKTSSIKRNSSSPLSQLKTLNYLDNMIAKKEAVRAGFDEALFINSDNLICECSSSNIFFIKDNKIYTPEAKCGLLNGIVRELLIRDIPEELNLQIIEGEFKIDLLYKASEVFITNSVIQVMPVVRIDDQFLGNGLPGSTTKKIMSYYKNQIQKVMPAIK
ncbi:MAG: branched-chain amino acid aminotransferase/4-amino-4-deoxychorismate lyase [Clostridia bacterium]|jgi:D-amino acid aminotransferase|nr:branched-chain amino acid aminotransferase/4-amino-4-deoxychorismate lyase [Clostridia bacterium]